jgi:hypothetical protein
MCLRILAVLLVITNCCMPIAGANAEIVPQDVTYSQFANNPSSFSGKRIRIRAIFVYGFELSALRSPTQCAEHDPPVWVDFDDNLQGKSKRLFHDFPKGMGFVLATFVGKIETGGPYGTGQRLRLIVDEIEEVEAEQNAKRGIPVWAPHNCPSSSKTD